MECSPPSPVWPGDGLGHKGHSSAEDSLSRGQERERVVDHISSPDCNGGVPGDKGQARLHMEQCRPFIVVWDV